MSISFNELLAQDLEQGRASLSQVGSYPTTPVGWKDTTRLSPTTS